jgi:hypothetical protein
MSAKNNENTQFLPKPMNYPEKLEFFREVRDHELNKLSIFLGGAFDSLIANEIIIGKEVRRINASLLAAGFERGLVLVKPRRQGTGYTQLKLNGFAVDSLKATKLSKTKLKAYILKSTPFELEAEWLTVKVAKFTEEYWVPYAYVVSQLNLIVKCFIPRAGMQDVASYENGRKNDLDISAEVFTQSVLELVELDNEFDDLIFEINSIGGKHRGYKSVVCRWPISEKRIRYSAQTLIKNPEIAFVAWNLGTERIVRPIKKIKGVGESGFITTRLVQRLKQRRNEKALLRTGREHKALTKRRQNLLDALDKPVAILGELQK